MEQQNDVIYLQEGELSPDSEAEPPQSPENASVEEILKALKKKKIYKVRYKRKLPEWLMFSSLVEIPEDKELEEAMLNMKD